MITTKKLNALQKEKRFKFFSKKYFLLNPKNNKLLAADNEKVKLENLKKLLNKSFLKIIEINETSRDMKVAGLE